jgi:hypothetical protein
LGTCLQQCLTPLTAAFSWEVSANNHTFHTKFKEKGFLCWRRKKFKEKGFLCWRRKKYKVGSLATSLPK